GGPRALEGANRARPESPAGLPRGLRGPPRRPERIVRMSERERLLAMADRVLRLEAESIAALRQRLDDRFVKAVELVRDCRGRVIVTGMGKSGIIGRKIAATLASTGTPAYF